MATLPEDRSVAIDELESAITELESRLESARAEHDEAKARQVELELENANLRRELGSARERQTATSDILKMIASSPSDVQPVFEAIVNSAAQLFDCTATITTLRDGKSHWNATAASIAGFEVERARAVYPIPFDPDRSPSARAILERRIIEIPDVTAPDTPEFTRKAAAAGDFQSITFVPLVDREQGIGTIIFTHPQTGFRFSERQLAIIQTFADQAVIAIQNARLFDQTREALEQQTATSDILKVIASSPSEVQPVLDVIVNSAAELFAPHTAAITTLQDGKLHWRAIAASGPSFDHEKAKSIYPIQFDPDRSPSCRAIMERRIIEIPDVEAPGTPELTRWVAAAGGFRSATFVPLIHRGEGIGTINLTTPQVGFRLTEKQLTLVKTFADQAVIAIENTRLFNETREALERQTATADILKVIASSPSDVQPVFEAIASSAKTLLGAFSTTVLRFIGDELHLVAYTPTDPKADEALQSSFPRPLAEFPTFALVRNGETIQFPDTEADDVPSANKELGRLRGFRSVLFTPLMNQGTPVGIISVTRAEPGAFGPHHIQLLQTFADQAVIAIENTRLFNETKEALERQTATADILKVIASSPSDVQPVFDAIAHSANRLIGGFSAAVFRYSDGRIHLAAFTPTDAEGDAVLQSSFPVRLAEFPPYQLTRDGAPVELPDTDLEPAARDIARARGYRSMLFAPLMNDGAAIGIITVTRVAPGPFGEQHTRLLQMFADQAVIAIKNVGLFNEVQQRTNDLSESLRQQTAVGDVLKTISRSTFDLQPVLDTLVNSAAQLCDADMAFIMRRVGDEYRAGAAVGYTEAYIDFLTSHPLAVNRGTVTGRAVLEQRPVQIADVVADPEYTLHETTTLAGQRTTLGVPLLRENEPIGVIVLARQRVEPFTEKQIDLVTTFADQAVIAIENVRLFNEVRQRTEDLSESLQQQTATADVLKVISRSAFDLETVLNTLTESAARLSDADMAAVTRQHPEGGYHHATRYSFPPEWDRFSQSTRVYPGRGSLVGRVLLEGKTVQIPDVLADPEYAFPEQQRAGGYRTLLGVPLLREGQPIGVLFLGRTTVEPFSDKQIELVSTFADQAVIAIENVRLFDEVQARTRDLSEALTYQTGSANILRVIAASPTDVKPVLKAIVESACELCEADDALVTLKDGDDLVFQEQHGSIPVVWQRQTIKRETPSGRAVIDGRSVHVHDLLGPEGDEFPVGREYARHTGVRTVLSVPLLREGNSVGVIVLRRTEVNPFSDKQANLLQTFADQAVIAIGNVRLFEEVQAKTRDLTEALQQQTATGEVLKVIASSPTDVEPALQAICESACAFCDAYDAGVLLKIGDDLHFSAHHGPIRTGREPRPISRKWVVGRSVVDKVPVQVPDFRAPEASEFPEGQRQSREQGHRCTLSVPLLREGEAIGALALRRLEPIAFSDKQIALLQTFADQAVIAIGNVRLFEEVQAKTRDLQEALTYQTGSANILQVIASSPTDVGPVLNAIVESACELCDANDTIVFLREGDRLSYKAHHGPIPVVFGENRAINRGYVAGRAMIDKIPIHVPDVFSEDAADFPESRELSRRDGIRSILCVPMLRENESIGAILLRRTEVHPFTDKQIALLQTFANQAVIAIGNVRLFEEVQARTRELTEALEQQTATSEVLETISASTGELDPVFSKMLENATRICDAKFGTMNLYEEGGFRTVALYNAPKAYIDTRIYKSIRPHPASGLGTVEKTHRTVHIDDIRTQPPYIEGNPNVRALADLAGARTVVVVPMLKEDELIGTITIFRQEVKPFTEKQTELVASFANQAVIAIENARLLNELRQRTNDLSKSLDDLRTAQDRLVQTEKLASLGQLTAGIAHEIKNPLNFVNNFAALSAELTEELNDVLKPTELAEKVRAEVDELTGLLKDNLEKVVQHGKRADSIVKNMLLHSREGGGEHRPSDINALIDESLNLAYHGARAEKPGFNITLERDFDPEAGQLDLFPQEITRVFLNLISNGFYAANKRSKEGGEPGFEPTLRVSTKNLGQAVEIRIRDNGTGIPSEVKEKMFNPFFTTKPAGEGTGLGLSMSHDIIVKQHGGTIDVDTEQGQGHFTEFRIVLPRTSNFAETSRG